MEQMRIPKVISKNNHEYILEKQVNEKLFLYKDLLYGYKECFSLYDLGLIEEQTKVSRDRKQVYHF